MTVSSFFPPLYEYYTNLFFKMLSGHERLNTSCIRAGGKVIASETSWKITRDDRNHRRNRNGYTTRYAGFEKGAARLNAENSLRGVVKCAPGSHYCGIRNIGYDY